MQTSAASLWYICAGPDVWGYFSVKSGGGIHEFSDSQVNLIYPSTHPSTPGGLALTEKQHGRPAVLAVMRHQNLPGQTACCCYAGLLVMMSVLQF